MSIARFSDVIHARCRKVLLPALLAGVLFALPGADRAWAALKVEFSPRLQTAIRNGGADPAAERRQMEADFNDGLQELGKTNAAAKTLYDSNQTIRVVCYGDPEAGNRTPATGMLAEPAETLGDFDAAGNPKRNGKAIIIVDCSTVQARKGFYAVPPGGFTLPLINPMYHELLHATNRARRHPPDSLSLYRQWERDFAAALQRARRAARRGARRTESEKKVSMVPGETGQPSGQPEAEFASVPATPGTGGPTFNVSFGVGADTIDRPAVKFGRFEAGAAVLEVPAFEYDTEDTGVALDASVDAEYGMLGLPGVYGGIRASYVDSQVSDTLDEVQPPAGAQIGLFSPDIGMGTGYGLGMDRSLTNLRFKSEYTQYSFDYRAWTWFDFDGIAIAPVISFGIGQIETDDHLHADYIQPDINIDTTFMQRTEVTSTTYAPGLGLKLRYDLGDFGTDANVFLFGELTGQLQYNTADADWMTQLPIPSLMIDPEPRRQSFSESDYSWAGSASGGIGFEARGITTKIEAGYRHDGSTPVLTYDDPRSTVDGTGGATLDFEDREEYAVGVRISFGF
jgi:hypothetical protein